MLSWATPRHGFGIALIGTLVVAGAVVVPHDAAKAAAPCMTKVTSMKSLSKSRFAADSLLRRYHVHVDYPGKNDWHDQTANAIYGIYPANASPVLINSPLGERITTGDQVQLQRPKALSAINGDFYLSLSIRGKSVEVSRGPMVKAGQVLRAERDMKRVVGVDRAGHPFAGMMGVTGSIKAETHEKVKIVGVNWETVQPSGVTVYTSAWSSLAGSPRPAGAVEWVLNRKNEIRKVRSSVQNSAELGAKVRSNSRVIAFPAKYASVGSAGVAGQTVKVVISQRTNSDVSLLEAVGRRLPLVLNGVAAPLGCAGYGRSGQASARPRTVIGWTKSGAWRSLTIPGSIFTGPGLRNGGLGLANEAALARKLGMYNAFELDGGGSTTLYTRSVSGHWNRRDLFRVKGGDYERPVTNAIAFVTHR